MPKQIVISGWGQITQPKLAEPPFLDPVDMMERAAREAGEIAGKKIWSAIDTLLLVRTQSRNLMKPDAELAKRLGLNPRHSQVSGIGGEVPQHYVNQAAGMLAREEANAVLICGAETYYPRDANAITGEGALIQGVPDDYDADDATGSDELEQRHGLTLPIHGFPLFETALWGASGKSRAEWLNHVGRMWSKFSEVAAQHPNAWTREAASIEEIITPGPENRPICSPYTKRLVSLVSADLGAAIIVTTAELASKSSHDKNTVYFLGGGFAKDRQRFMSNKENFTHSPSLATAAAKAQKRAGLSVDDIDGFDLYSCFPCAVSVAKRVLRIADDDPRSLTATGGLGFFGGPGSNYALHGIATLAERIADGDFKTGMATAIGWFMHKYAVGIYADAPNDHDFSDDDLIDDENPEAGRPPVARIDDFNGEGVIDTYTVVYSRDREPVKTILLGTTDDGQRFIANTPTEREVFDAFINENQIGRRVSVQTTNEKINLASLIE
ncbi:MAG: hypothetical protein ACU84Q_06465 [Gammaproteobacteria bacterium]